MQILDSITLAAVVAELQRTWTGARIDRIHLPTPHEMAWQLRGDGRNGRLFFSARGSFARLHLTDRKSENPPQPPMFGMLLRKHLEGSRLLRIEQLELERVVQLVTTGRDELGDPIERALIAEITGKHSNFILLDRPWGTVLGALRIVTPEVSRERQIMPGLPYDPPPIAKGKHDPRTLTDAQLFEVLAKGGTLDSVLLSGVHSLSRHAIGQLLEAAGLDPRSPADGLDADQLSRLATTWQRAMGAIARGEFDPRLTPGRPWDYSVLSLGGAGLAPVCPLLDAYYGRLETAERLEGQRAGLRAIATERLSRLRHKVASLTEALEAAQEAETWRQWGELIQAYGYQLPPGSDCLRVPNHFLADSPEVAIPLDPRETAMANAQRLFRRYRKARAAREVSERFLAEARSELAYWEGIQGAIALCDTLAELAEIRAEITPEAPAKGRSTKPPPETQPLSLRSSDGLEILVGKNNRQNDRVTMKLARADDWWFHTRDIPGSHVLVRLAPGQRDLPERTRHEAAMVAAYYSQARDSGQVPVLYTQRRHLKKPAGARPGLVLYEREKTLFVTPDPAMLARLQGLAES